MIWNGTPWRINPDVCTIVREKFMVGNIHEIKICGRKVSPKSTMDLSINEFTLPSAIDQTRSSHQCRILQ